MPKYRVQLWPVVCISIDNVEADNPRQAMERAEDIADLYHRFDDEGAVNQRDEDHDETPDLVEYVQYDDTIEMVVVQRFEEGATEPAEEFEFDKDGNEVK